MFSTSLGIESFVNAMDTPGNASYVAIVAYSPDQPTGSLPGVERFSDQASQLSLERNIRIGGVTHDFPGQQSLRVCISISRMCFSGTP